MEQSCQSGWSSSQDSQPFIHDFSCILNYDRCQTVACLVVGSLCCEPLESKLGAVILLRNTKTQFFWYLIYFDIMVHVKWPLLGNCSFLHICAKWCYAYHNRCVLHFVPSTVTKMPHITDCGIPKCFVLRHVVTSNFHGIPLAQEVATSKRFKNTLL